jgi:spore maturation protein CgeB
MNNPKVLMLDLAYWQALTDHYSTERIDNKKGLEFGIGYYLNKAFLKKGWTSNHFFINDLKAQQKWLLECAPNRLIEKKISDLFNSKVEYTFSQTKKIFHYTIGWQIARIQILFYKPDIIWFFGPSHIPKFLFSSLPKQRKTLKIAHISAPLPNLKYFENYDLMLSSQNIHVSNWRANNFRAELFKPAIDIDSCLTIDWKKRNYLMSFVGGISNLHQTRLNFLEEIANRFDIKLFGPGKENIPKNSKLLNKWNPPVWGNDLFKLFANSKMSINIHGDDSPNEAANVRLFEATGCGSLLFTEANPNLSEYFNNDEVVAFNSLEELIDKITFFKENERIAEEIANAGRKKTISSHTYDHRVSEISETLLKFL